MMIPAGRNFVLAAAVSPYHRDEIGCPTGLDVVPFRLRSIAMLVAMGIVLVMSVTASADPLSPPQSDAIDSWVRQNGADASSDSKVIRRRRPADRQAVSPSKKAESAAGIGGVGALFWPLMAVLLMIGLAAILFRKWMGGSQRLGSDGVIRVMARQYLSNKQSLCLVRVGQRIVLIGVTPDRITPLSDIHEPGEVAAMTAAAQRSSSASFTAALSSFTGKAPRPDDDDRMAAEPNEQILPGRIASTSAGIRSLLDRVRRIPTVEAAQEQ